MDNDSYRSACVSCKFWTPDGMKGNCPYLRDPSDFDFYCKNHEFRDDWVFDTEKELK